MKKLSSGEIQLRINNIKESVETIKNNLPESLEEFKSLGIAKDGIYKQLEFAIQNILDICSLINSDLDLGISVSYKETIENLYNVKLIDEKLKGDLEFLNKLRDVLIYDYDLISDEIAFKNFQEYLEQIGRFLNFGEKLLEGG